MSLLEHERAHGLLSEGAYQAGRQIEMLFERARRGPGFTNWQGGSRVDAWVAHELAILYGIENAQKVEALINWMRRELGREDTWLITRVLGERRTYVQVAAEKLRFGEREKSYVARRFRDALEALSDARAARGPDRHNKAT